MLNIRLLSPPKTTLGTVRGLWDHYYTEFRPFRSGFWTRRRVLLSSFIIACLCHKGAPVVFPLPPPPAIAASVHIKLRRGLLYMFPEEWWCRIDGV